MTDRERVHEIFLRSLAAVEAEAAVERSLERDDPGAGPFVLVGAGKAACAMARGAVKVLGARITRGEVVTKDDHTLDVERIEVREASHPLPDTRGLAAARAALTLAGSLAPSEKLLVLLSGGASALWPHPVAGISLEDKRETTSLLLRAGCDIAGLNSVRKHLSQLKGGGLARAARPACCLTLAVSDVAGDAPEWIGSGPTVADPSTFEAALDVLRRAQALDRVPRAVRSYLEAGRAGRHDETPKPGDPIFTGSEVRIVARLADGLAAAEKEARRQALDPLGLGEALHGDVREVARRLAGEARALRGSGPVLLIAGGEPTVRVAGNGTGGRAQELALAFALELGDQAVGVTALFAGTDGSDGPTDAAGAIVDAGSLGRIRAGGLEPESHLARNDSHPALSVGGDLLWTGPTNTNVTDLALILVRPTDGMG